VKIKLTDIKKTYGAFAAIKGVSLAFEEGKFYGLLGPNGAGKTTLFNLLIQTINQSAGTIEWEVAGRRVEWRDVYQHVGVVFQEHRLDGELTVEENLVTRGALYGLSKAQVNQRIDDIDAYLSIGQLKQRKYGSLSGGQKRKIDIARALLHEPSILLLDEPTTGLDPKSRRDLWQAIYDLNQKRKMTVILITHYLEEMAFCDTLNVLINGSVHYSGTVDEFIAQNSQMNLILNLKANTNSSVLEDTMREKRAHVTGEEVIYRDVSMREIMTIIADNNHLQVIEDFTVQEATLEVAYLNLLETIQGGN